MTQQYSWTYLPKRLRLVSVGVAAGTFAAAIALLGSALSAPTTAAHYPKFGGDKTLPMGIPLAPPSNAWLTKPWLGNDAPFTVATREVREKVRRAGDNEAATHAVYIQEKASARQSPLTLVAQYRWLYAAIRLAYYTKAMDWHSQEAVALLDPGTFRTVARMRYAAIIQAAPESAHPELTALAQRLMAAKPKDLWLRDHAIHDLGNTRETVPQAVALATNWVADSPTSAQAHGVLGDVLADQWFWSGRKDRAVAKRIVAEDEAFLRLIPPNDPGRTGAEHMVAAVRKALRMPPNTASL